MTEIKLLNTEPDPTKDDGEYTYIVSVNGYIQAFLTDYKMLISENGELILKNDNEELIINPERMEFIRKLKGDLTSDDAYGNLRHTNKTQH